MDGCNDKFLRRSSSRIAGLVNLSQIMGKCRLGKDGGVLPELWPFHKTMREGSAGLYDNDSDWRSSGMVSECSLIFKPQTSPFAAMAAARGMSRWLAPIAYVVTGR